MKKRLQEFLLVGELRRHRRSMMGLYTDPARAHETRRHKEAMAKLIAQPKRDRARWRHECGQALVHEAWRAIPAILTGLIISLIAEWVQNK